MQHCCSKAAFGEPLRVLLDAKPGKAAAKRWDWVRKGAPLIVEVGPRDMEDGKVAVLRRDRAVECRQRQARFRLHREGRFRRKCCGHAASKSSRSCSTKRTRGAKPTWSATSTASRRSTPSSARTASYPGWAEVQWSRPEGAALDQVVEQLKALKLTFRNVPLDAAPADRHCACSPATPAVERIYVARAY